MVEVFGPLSARPPTPPRTTSRVLSEKDQIEGSPVVAQTPRDTPLSATVPNGASSNRQSKRVNFSPWTRYIKPPSFTDAAAVAESELKALPPSNECKPTKSILKQTSSPVVTNSSPAVVTYTPESFAMLLESITQQLTGESLSSRLDAYMQFFGALRAYDDLPTGKEIVDRLVSITQFIQRDVSRGPEGGEPLQSNLVVQALKLANTLLWAGEVAPHLPDDFKAFLIDQSISGLNDAKAPKSLLMHYLSILTASNVHTKVMTSSRLSRLLPALVEVTNRVGGSTILSQRLTIYSRILHHSKTFFVAHASLWMEHIVSGCLHHMKDVRLKAIGLGFQLANMFGPNANLSKGVYDIFDRPMEKDPDRKLAAEICERMLRMMADPDSGVHVPQIWSVMILLLRNKRTSVDQWEHFRDFVLVLQRCFNCSDTMIKAQAIFAWNRFVFVASPGETTNLALLKMLGKPIISQFERKKEKGGQPSGIVWSSYHNLLYYAFRPSVPYHHLDTVWEEYIALPSAFSNPVPNLSNRLAIVLSNMFWSSQGKGWTVNKANETHKLAPKELPTLDPKWLRSRITKVLKVLEAILRSSLWANEVEKSEVAAAWINLARALSQASSKEITPSPDSMQAVAHVLNLLQRLWKAGPASLNAQNSTMDKFFDRFRFLSTTMICSLGSIPFTEKLFVKTADETFQAANTPTHRHPRPGSNVDSPIVHLLRLISEAPGISKPTPAYLRLVNDILQAACNGRNVRGSRLELLRQCAHLYPQPSTSSSNNLAGIVWQSTAQLAADTLRSYPVESARARDGSAVRDYENSAKILSAGLKFSNAAQDWDKLVDSLVRVVKTEKSDRDITPAIVEPLAQSMMTLGVQEAYLPLSSLLNHSLSIAYFHQDVGSDDVSRLARAHPPKRLLELLNRILRESYEKFDPVEHSGIADYIEALTSFLGSGVAPFRFATLENLQPSLALWIQDESRKFNLESGVESRILTACRALSSALLNILQTSSPQDINCISKQQLILCAGLESSHMSVAKRFIDFWNSIFGQQKPSPCPEPIARALRSLESRIKQQKPAHEKSKDTPGKSGTTEVSKQAEIRADMHEKSRIAFILDNSRVASDPEAFTSSPITQDSAPLPASLEPQNSSQPQSPAVENTPDQIKNGDAQIPLPSVGEPKQRSEVFSMIENLRSSSPANSPRQLGFMTPPHLRNLRNPERETGTPQTPTLPAVANDAEDGFLGSSPTPGTRDRPQAVRSGLPRSWTISTEGNIDPPSSPPEVQSQAQGPSSEPASLKGTTSKKKESGSKKSKRSPSSSSKKSKKSHPLERPRFKQREGTPLIKRLRSSSGKTPTSAFSPRREERLDGSPTQNPLTNPAPKNTTPSSSKKPGSSKSSSKKSRSKTIDLTGDVPRIDFGLDDTIADSFSDDMETQLASQLEQDLESAVDSTTKSDSQKASESQSQPRVTRKRKREVEGFVTPTNKERRRSSRFSYGQEEPVFDDPETIITSRGSRSKKKALAAVDEQAVAVASPLESNPKKRRRQSKGDISEVEVESINTEQQVDRSPSESSKKRHQSKGSSTDSKQSKPTTTEKETGQVQNGSQTPDAFSQKQKSPKLNNTQSNSETQTSTESSTLSSSHRRSSRLSGHVAAVSTEEVPPPKTSSSRSRKRNAKGKSAGPDSPAVEKPISDLRGTSTQSSTDNRNGDQRTSVEQAMERSMDSGASPSENLTQVSQIEDTPMQDADSVPNTALVVGAAVENEVGQLEEQPEVQGKEHMDVPSDRAKRKADKQITSRTTQTASNPGIIATLQKVLDDAKSTSLNRSTLKQIDDLLFDIRVEAHEALRRNTG
ncbi:Rap1-interacting factor 1 N terminal-domain-containing protein [Aspergillus ambiguus]|uniref:putative telomere length regulator protein (Rif1) n=1 Tax=Aspergillus ambiguus TaxID=176160 RepID=UPI003CCD5781